MAAAKKIEPEVKDETPKVEAPKHNSPPPGIAIGRIVHYHKSVQTNNGAKLKTFAAIITELADGASNFQPQDGAVSLTVFISHGGVVESKQGVMYSETPMPNRWNFPPKV